MVLLYLSRALVALISFTGLTWCICTSSVDPHTVHGATCELIVFRNLIPSCWTGSRILNLSSLLRYLMNSSESLLFSIRVMYSGLQLDLSILSAVAGIS